MELLTTAQSESTAPRANSPGASVAAPASSKITQLRPGARSKVARQLRPVPVPIRAQMWERPAAYAAVAALAAIGFLLVATDWHARDKKPAAIAIPPNAPPTIATTNQSIAVSVRVDPQFAEEGLRSATEGQPPQDAIGLAGLRELLCRAHRQSEEFALA